MIFLFVAYPVYSFFSVNMFESSKTETIWFLRVVSTTLHLLYMQISSLCFWRRRSSFLGGGHDGIVSILPSSDGRKKGVLAIQVYCLDGGSTCSALFRVRSQPMPYFLSGFGGTLSLLCNQSFPRAWGLRVLKIPRWWRQPMWKLT